MTVLETGIKGYGREISVVRVLLERVSGYGFQNSKVWARLSPPRGPCACAGAGTGACVRVQGEMYDGKDVTKAIKKAIISAMK